jgi:hypothetical protein
MTHEILPDLILTTRVNQEWEESGLDSFDECLSKSYFNHYPHKVNYKFNTRGFRDDEWPDQLTDMSYKMLQRSVWCFGDSFTLGLGCPYEHMWVKKLGKYLKLRTINISMDGASNDWIARKVINVINEINPTTIVVHWSYFDRKESLDTSLIDEERRITPYTNEDYQRNNHHKNLHDNLKNTLKCVKKVEEHAIKCQVRIIHSVISDEINSYPLKIRQTIQQSFDKLCREYIHKIEKIDLGRDGFHYGVRTSDKFAKNLSDIIKG